MTDNEPQGDTFHAAETTVMAAMLGLPAQADLNDILRNAAQNVIPAMKRAVDSGLIVFLKRASQYAKELAQVMERNELWNDEERRLFAILVPRGWLLSPDVPAGLLPLLLQKREREGIRAVDRTLVKVYNPRFCTQMIRASYGRPAFALWRATFEKALRAHRRREFALAIPIWLSALDGIVGAELGADKIYTRVTRKKAAENLKASLRSGPDDFDDQLSTAWVDVLAGVATSVGRGKVPAILNRHAVLHGAKPRIGTERDSIQGVLLLHLLHYFLEQRETPAP